MSRLAGSGSKVGQRAGSAVAQRQRPGLPDPGASFINPLYPGADPWVIRRDGWYYLCQAGPGGRIEVWKSRTLTRRGECRVVWTPPRFGWNRAQVWAPELHYLDGRWYIYYAASDGRNANHRMGVLEGTTHDPQDAFLDRGQLYTGDDVASGSRNRWAIDGTILRHRGRLYFLWSGWQDERDVQHLYLAPMSDPCTVSGNRVRLCDNDSHPWERCGDCPSQRGLHEAPQVLIRHGRIMVVYSCSGSWQPSYKLGLIWMDEQADPTDPRSWRKLDRPVFQPYGEVFGVGHCCFTSSPDGTEDWLIYHAKRYRSDGWHRVVRAQRFGWHEDGFPDFGQPAPPQTPQPLPSGDEPSPQRVPPRAA